MGNIAGRQSQPASRVICREPRSAASGARFRRVARISAGLAATIAIAGGVLRPAAASTDGNNVGLLNADQILEVMGFNFSLENIFSNPVTLVNVDPTLYGYIKNDYIGAVVGYTGTYTTQVDATPHTVTHTSPGMITFGNLKGSLLTGLDDQQGLVGLNPYDFLGVFVANQTAGFGGWPIPNYADYNGVKQVESTAYTRAKVDGTTIAVVGSDAAQTLIPPRFENNALGVQYRLLAGTGTPSGGTGQGIGNLPGTSTSDVIMDQVIELYRSTARLHWRLYNGDSNAHTVTLRFTLPIRPAAPGSDSGISPLGGFFFEDPILGLTTQTDIIPGPSLPDIFTVYGQRYDDPSSTTLPPFAAKTIFRGYNATLPSSVYISDPFDVYPGNGGFNPTDITTRSFALGTGIAESLYFGPYALQPGGSQDIYTFYGNGTPTEDLQDDVVVGAESREAVNFNSDALNSPAIVGNTQIVTDATQLAAAQALFLTPNPIEIAGSVYNRTLSQNFTSLTNTSMSLILPSSGLVLTTPPGSTKVDTATKTIGTVPPDTDVPETWYIKATGTDYGVLSYQIAATSKEIGSRSVTRQITVPAIPLHPVTNTAFQLIGFPFQFDQGATNQADPATIINKLSPSSLQDNPAIFYQWIPSGDSNGNDNGHYVIATSIQPGQGYFFRPASTRILFPYGASPISGQTPNTSSGVQTSASVIQLSLNQGWNMITNPYLYSIPLSQLRVTQALDGQLSATSSPFLTAANAGLVRGDVFFFDTTTSSYDFFDFSPANPTPELNPWTGYWIYALQKVIVTFPIPTTHDTFVVPSSSGGEPSTRGVIAHGSWATKGPSINNWTLQLIASRPGSGSKTKREDHAAIIGVKPGITTKNAAMPKPPTPASDYVYIGLVKPNTTGTTRYAEVFQAPSSSAKTWDFEVTSDQAGLVTIQWPNTAQLPRLIDLTLKDATGKKTALRDRSSIQVNAQAGRAMRFTITAEPRASTPLAIHNIQVVNVGTRAMGSREVRFALTQDATVTAQVMALNGRVVSTIASGRAMAAGETTPLKWSGRGDNQAALPIGIYTIKITARTDDGHIVVREQQVTLLR